MKNLLVIITLLVFNSFVKAQNTIDTSKLIQFSGMAVSEKNMEGIPYTTVYDRTIRRGVFTDQHGFFSMVAMPGDTLIFTNYGFHKTTYIIPDTLKDKRYSIIHIMKIDTLSTLEVIVYPWPSKDDFAKYFINMKSYDDAYSRAMKELSGESLAFVAAKLENDASLSTGLAQNQYLTQLYTHGQVPVNNLLNPYSWAKFIQEWKKGNLKRE